MEITIKLSTVDFLGQSEDVLAVDEPASRDAYTCRLIQNLEQHYEGVTVEVEWTDETMTATDVRFDGVRSDPEHYEDEVIVDAIMEQVYGNMDLWIVDGFNTAALQATLEAELDRYSCTGHVTTITVANAGPLETQDAVVVIVELDGSHTVAYRYSTHSQDDEWRLGSVEDACQYAAEYYANIVEAKLSL